MSRIRSLIVHHGPDGNAQPGGFISNAIPTNGAFTARALFPSASQLAVEKARIGVYPSSSQKEFSPFCRSRNIIFFVDDLDTRGVGILRVGPATRESERERAR